MEKRFEELSKLEWARDLSFEDIHYITTQIVKKEASLRGDLLTSKMFGTLEDVSQNILLQLCAKDSNGKRGLRAMQKDMSVAHLVNTLYFIARNEYNGNLRKKSYQDLVHNTRSLDEVLSVDYATDTQYSLLDKIADERAGKNNVEKANDDLYMVSVLKNVPNKEINKYMIKYQDKPEVKFSLREFANLFYELSNGFQLKASDFKDIIYEFDYEKNEYKPASKDCINKLIRKLKTSLIKNKKFNEMLREA